MQGFGDSAFAALSADVVIFGALKHTLRFVV
jgi:hypothetical protein